MARWASASITPGRPGARRRSDDALGVQQVLRARWEYGHVVHAVLLLLGFAALATSVLVDTVPWRASGRGVRDGVRRAA